MVTRIKQAEPDCEVILLTAYGNIPDGVQAIKNGAFDYITKGDDNNKIIPLLSRAGRQGPDEPPPQRRNGRREYGTRLRCDYRLIQADARGCRAGP